MMEMMKLEEKDACDWSYRGEGAANLVLSYTGSSPVFVGKVLRVPKVATNELKHENGCTFLSKHERILWEGAGDFVTSPTKESAEQLYVECVMIPLLGSEFVDLGTRILVSREFLEFVEGNVLCQRPLWRVDASKVNTCADSVLLMSDHSIFPLSVFRGESCVSVEIKPKCGFLPSSSFIADQNAIKKNVSRFKMHQTLKLKEREISQLSEYDPLDLFSGSWERMQRAIKALFATPQNNLRAFLNGNLIYGGLGGGNCGTNFVKVESFGDYIESLVCCEKDLRTANFMRLVAKAIIELGVLDRLLNVQKLDSFDIEGAIHAYYDVVSQPCKVCRITGEDRHLGKYSSIHLLPFDDSLKIVKDYLIAATAKDCSLMISFRPMREGDPESDYRTIYLDSTKQHFECKACFIDLDLRPLKKMEYYYELDQKIVSSYKQTVKPGLATTKSGSIEGYETGY